jgi:hypothetical protein
LSKQRIRLRHSISRDRLEIGNLTFQKWISQVATTVAAAASAKGGPPRVFVVVHIRVASSNLRRHRRYHGLVVVRYQPTSCCQLRLDRKPTSLKQGLSA